MKHTVAATAFLLALASCGGDTSPVASDVIDRETFIATYVDLRLAATEQSDFRVSPEQRAEVLARHGVSGEELIRFADVHGRDLEFMNEVWSEVETRFQDASGGEASGEPPPTL
jgi:hypothetical protein